MSQLRNKILVSLMCILMSGTLFAQSRGNSPYTLYGVGFKNEITNGISFAMGGIGIAYQDRSSINPLNPASFASFDSLSFVFDAGLVMNSSKFSTTTQSEKGSYASVSHLLFGFQIAKPWKVGFGLIPYSNVGYNTVSSGVINDIPYSDIYSGNGGINKAYSTHAFNITKNLSIGIEAGVYFGEIENNYIRLLTESEYSYHIKESNTNSYKKLYFRYGVQYATEIKKDLKLTIGAIFSTDTDIETDRKHLIQTVQASSTGLSTPIETFEETSETGFTTIPKNFGIGFMLTKAYKWKAGLDFQTQAWSNYKSFNTTQPLKNSFKIAIGGEYIPDANAVRSYFNYMAYRFGIRYEKSPLYLNSTQLSELGISFGVGLPFRNNNVISTLNMGVEIGQRGTTKNDLIKETFIKFKVGISIRQQWFKKFKYD